LPPSQNGNVPQPLREPVSGTFPSPLMGVATIAVNVPLNDGIKAAGHPVFLGL
jgi:hypothetical protein